MARDIDDFEGSFEDIALVKAEGDRVVVDLRDSDNTKLDAPGSHDPREFARLSTEFAGTSVEAYVIIKDSKLAFEITAGEPDPTEDRFNRDSEDMSSEVTASTSSKSAPDEQAPELASERDTRPDRYQNWDDERDNRFVNPYTFVPIPKSVQRSRPPSHALCDDGQYMGEIVVEWVAKTPIMCSSTTGPLPDDLIEQAPEQASAQRDYGAFATDGAGNPIVPGSAIKGAVRALHETLVGGCMRVIDGDFIPVYRTTYSDTNWPANEIAGDWKLGRVEPNDDDNGTGTSDADDMQPGDQAEGGDSDCVTLRLASEVRRVKGKDLVRLAWGRPTSMSGAPAILKTGQRFLLGFGNRVTNPDRSCFELKSAAVTTGRGNCWTVLVNRALHPTDNDYWCVAGQFDVAGVESVVASSAALKNFAQAQKGADEHDKIGKHHVKVDRSDLGTDVEAWAKNPRTPLQAGDVVWVRVSGGKAVQLSLSQLWRERGVAETNSLFGLKQRNGIGPCSQHDELCPSCQLFGSADSEGDRADKPGAEQNSYRGRVRFGDAAIQGSITDPIALAPLSKPRPAYARFYVTGSSRRWSGGQKMRGRKFYWHGDPEAQAGRLADEYRRHKRRGDQDNVTRWAELAEPESTLRSTIRFVGLTESEVGSLIAALDPKQVLQDQRPTNGFDPGNESIWTRLGGGKPLGLGSVEPTIVSMTMLTADSRYLSEAEDKRYNNDEEQQRSVVDAFIESVPGKHRSQTWPSLAAVLSPGHVPAEAIWYPPARPWSTVSDNANGFEKFDESFTFFVENEKAEGPKCQLPYPTNGDQSLPILKSTGKRGQQ